MYVFYHPPNGNNKSHGIHLMNVHNSDTVFSVSLTNVVLFDVCRSKCSGNYSFYYLEAVVVVDAITVQLFSLLYSYMITATQIGSNLDLNSDLDLELDRDLDRNFD